MARGANSGPMRLLAPLALLLAGACAAPPIAPAHAGPNDAGVVLDEDGRTAADYCESIVDFFCPYYLRCERMAAASVEECRSVFLPACNARFEPSYASLDSAGLLRLSPAGLEACAAHLNDVACEQQLKDLDGPCAAMWQGSQPAGGACGFDIESFVCAPGTACVLDQTFCGTCQALVDDGTRCDSGEVTCGPASSCEDDECVARSLVGESCADGARCVLGATCGSDGICAGPSYVAVGEACDFFSRCPYRSECLQGQCRLAVPLGAGCGPTIPCDSGGTCADGLCSDLIAQGDACSRGEQCQTGVCAEGRCSVLPGACFP